MRVCTPLAAIALFAHAADAADGTSLSEHFVVGVNRTLGNGVAHQIEYELSMPEDKFPLKDKITLACIYFLGLNWLGCDRCFLAGAVPLGMSNMIGFGLGATKGATFAGCCGAGVARIFNEQTGVVTMLMLIIGALWGLLDFAIVLRNMWTQATSINMIGFKANFSEDQVNKAMYIALFNVGCYVFYGLGRNNDVFAREKATKVAAADPDESNLESYQQLPA